MIKNLFKIFNEPDKEPAKEPDPKVEKVDDSPYKIFNPIFDPKKDDFGRVVELYNKIESFGRKCKDDDGELLEVEEKVPEQYWGLKFNPPFRDMVLKFNQDIESRKEFCRKHGTEYHIDDEELKILGNVAFYKYVVGDVLAIAEGCCFIYEYKTYSTLPPFSGTKEEIRDHLNTIRETYDIVYGGIYTDDNLKFKVFYAKIDRQTT